MHGLQVALKNIHNRLIADYDLHLCLADERDANVVIKNNDKGLEIVWLSGFSKRPHRLSIDINKFIAKQNTYPAAKQGAFNQALGRHSKSILDISAGWAGDALLMCSQGYYVDLVERNNIMALVLSQAMQRLSQSDWANKHLQHVPRVFYQQAEDYLLNEKPLNYDCIYFDPMFPIKKKQSAATNKYMQFLQTLLDSDMDAAVTLQVALSSGVNRVVVKRPHYADSLLPERPPNQQFKSKLVHYDVYLK